MKQICKGISAALICGALVVGCLVDAHTTTRVAVSSVSINEGDAALFENEEQRFTVSVEPTNAANKAVRWSSSREETATVDEDGLVKALAVGIAKITATAVDGSDKSGAVTVTVNATVTPPIDEDAELSPADIFALLKGQKAVTNGWADMYNDGAGMFYTNPATLALIDDATYPNPLDKRKAFTDAINGKAPAFIIVSGDVDLSDGKVSDTDHSYFDEFNATEPFARKHSDITFKIENDKTIIGVDNARVKFGGLRINGRTNVIIRNLTFWDAHGSTERDTSKSGNESSKASIDALVVEEGADIIPSGVWIDHCTFTDGTCNDMIRNYNHDGSFDIKHGRDITVSWCEFTNHDKVMLVGSDETKYLNADERRITLHHNYFHQTTQRTPRTRGTLMHIYNNYWKDVGVDGNNGYCLGPGRNAEFIVESNFFAVETFKSSTKIVDYYDASAYPAKVFAADNNVPVAPSAHFAATAKPWTPAYAYDLGAVSGLPTAVPADAGADKSVTAKWLQAQPVL
ncbi:MAG: Ig-like domain-containing protein [Treponema sp.]|jgi:pectate lyase|nr:Ig-like domain-containing protein [Treponema sp.]